MSTVHTNIFRDDDDVSMTTGDGFIIIRKAAEGHGRSYPSLAERFSGYTGDYVPEEWATGAAVGKEIAEIPNPVTLAAMQEAEMQKHSGSHKTYSSFSEMLQDLESEEETGC